jgi:hypothetical protein
VRAGREPVATPVRGGEERTLTGRSSGHRFPASREHTAAAVFTEQEEAPIGERDRERGDAARELLREFLANGLHHYGVVVAAAAEIGISEAELHHAMADLCMVSRISTARP